MSGLGGVAHALSKDCVGGHCDDHLVMEMQESHVGHASGKPTDSASNGSNGMEPDECNPFLCNALALTFPDSEVSFDQSEAALAWLVTSFSTLNEPENPDRPPNT
ncbi:hypothetical protein [Falsiruegeria litorea]|uniref:hypothetical protein n=1 Tax=Falsiruegeria litorea TaxID=1280831 RepID=UPI0013FE433F|nr:hypothetical protein [Falsiruegeria litorea]